MKIKSIALLILIVFIVGCSSVGTQPQKTADKLDGVGVMWIGRKSYRMPCIIYTFDYGDRGRMAWSCDWSKCGPDNECLDGLPNFGEVFGVGE